MKQLKIKNTATEKCSMQMGCKNSENGLYEYEAVVMCLQTAVFQTDVHLTLLATNNAEWKTHHGIATQ